MTISKTAQVSEVICSTQKRRRYWEEYKRFYDAYVINYEDLIANTYDCIRGLFGFIGLDEGLIPFILNERRLETKRSKSYEYATFI